MCVCVCVCLCLCIKWYLILESRDNHNLIRPIIYQITWWADHVTCLYLFCWLVQVIEKLRAIGLEKQEEQWPGKWWYRNFEVSLALKLTQLELEGDELISIKRIESQNMSIHSQLLIDTKQRTVFAMNWLDIYYAGINRSWTTWRVHSVITWSWSCDFPRGPLDGCYATENRSEINLIR